MARTAPFPFRDHHDPEVYAPAHNDVVDYLIRQYEEALGDSDKSSTIEDADYNEGRADAYVDALTQLLGVSWDTVNAWRRPSSAPAVEPEQR
ncbi:hypothetical protein Xcel_3485 (plasmid) [Xylanimonas cellulosilytica DSM 15894]|uniref:Uncharacterized protein n=1 Tax=Xylanimonas cellulosilytica (strain DSM 15894 / JCM 12276 / CECT 5975 / KCTC 9989 / LMG 20990 / NBRC 107835 / XIL07) TaxID=446471 RepID=D1C118_XYLCX|nr:hypothetical protein [Xylanimonas cellulosilytica]ACZ32484.1 hypothetical protein Xcel_3485 [Xylanimonas cellulosilytica DSM 15894]